MEHKILGLADDMLLALLPRVGSVEAALEVIAAFSLASGCLINWRKTKYTSVFVVHIPACPSHIDRVTGDDAHPSLGLPFKETTRTRRLEGKCA